MKNFFTCLLLPFLLIDFSAEAQTVRDKVVELSQTIQTDPPGVILNWNNPTGSSDITLFRRDKDALIWFLLLQESASAATTFTDTQVELGKTYEYGIIRVTGGIQAFGYLTTPVQAPAIENRGKMLVFVESALEAPLEMELERLRHDLVGDGWQVLWYAVESDASVASVKSQIEAAYHDDSLAVKSVLLFGQIPVPYSGNAAWDGHTDHQGAWPADTYYGDMDSDAWTDVTVNNTSAARPENDNVPGDGKFDQSFTPTALELAVGRVDFSNIDEGTFGATRTELYRRYLDKNHRWRNKLYTVENQAIVDDNFGYFSGEAFAADAYRNGYPLVGMGNVVAGDFFNDTDDDSYLFGYGCGGGTYTGAGGVGNSAQFGSDSVNIVFSMLFGSYHGDWDYSPNPFMPSALASKGGILTCGWAGRPDWFAHHLGAGETIGYSALLTQNSCDIDGYYPNFGECGAHIALMGDPSLRAQIVTPVTDLVLQQQCNDVTLNWTSSSQPNLMGYHVYRSQAFDGVYTRLTNAPISDNTFTDSNPVAGPLYYQVRAVAMEQTPSGSFYNTSTGVFGNLDFVLADPPVADAGPDQVLTCAQLSFDFDPCIAPFMCELTDANGGQISLPATLNQTGEYYLTVTDPATGCSSSDTLVVSENTTAPADLEAVLGAIDCATESAIFNATSTTAGVNFSWSGPNGFSSDEQNPMITEPGEYILTATDPVNGCTAVDSILVDVSFSAPDASAAGGDLTCDVSSVQLSGSSTTPDVTYLWTGPDNFVSTLQNPEVSLPGNYTLTVTAPNGCEKTAEAVVNLIGDLPEANPAVSGEITCLVSEVTITLNPDDAGYNFEWTGPDGFQSSDENPLVSVGGTYIVTLTNPATGCSSSDTLAVSENTTAPADVEAVLGTIDCATESAIFNATSTTAGVNFSWSGPNGFSSDEQNPMITEPGEYILTATDPVNGCTAVDSILVDVSFSAPDASAAGGDLTCDVNSVQLSGSSTTPDVTYLWTGPDNFVSTLQNPEVSLPGNYTLTVTAPNGCEQTAEAVVNLIGDLPEANPVVSGEITCLVSEVTITLNPDDAGYNFEWTGPDGFQSSDENPLVSVGGTYIVTLTNPATGCSSSDTLAVSENTTAPADVEAVLGTIDCATESAIFNATSTTAGVNFSWSGPNGFSSDEQNPMITEPGEYILTATDPVNGCSAVDSILVSASFSAPDASAAGGDLTCDVSSVQLSGSSTTPDVTYLWAGPDNFVSTLQNPEVSLPGNYTLTVTAPNGCEQTAEAVVNLIGDLPEANPVVSGEITCLVSEVTITLNPDDAGYNFEWTGPDGFQSSDENPLVSVGGTYSVIVTDPATNCTKTFEIEVNENSSLPAFDLPDVTIVCLGGSEIIQPPALCGEPNIVCRLNDQTAAHNWSVDEEGWYEFTATDTVTGCVSTDSFFVNSDSFELNLMLDGNVNLPCFNDTANITAIANTSDVTFRWTGNDPINDPSNASQVLGAGNYSLYGVTSNGCADTLSVEITTPSPLTFIFGETLDCDGFIEVFAVPEGGTPPYTVNITPTGLIPPNSPYEILITDANGCTKQFFGLNLFIPFASTTTKTDETVAGAADGTATVSATGGTAPYTYLWNTGDTTATVSNLPPGDYMVTVTDAMDCSHIHTVTILPGVSATRELPGLENLVLSPNPTSGFFDLKLEFAQPQDVSAELLDMTGRVLERKVLTNTATPAWQFDLSARAAGVYICKITTRGKTAGLRVVKIN